MASDGVTVNTNTGVDGNSYTTSIANDDLTNNDFLKLMIQELKLQDPTKPMDSKQMLQTQMQMSTINTNQELAASMKTLQTSFTQSALSNAASVIGRNVEDGNIGENGINKAYTVRSIENVSGEVQVKAQQILFFENRVKLTDATDDTKSTLVNYNASGEIIGADGEKTGEKIALKEPGVPLVKDGKLVVLDADNKEISDHKYELVGDSVPVYSDELTSIPFSQVTKIF